jgi:hypothetical protein
MQMYQPCYGEFKPGLALMVAFKKFGCLAVDRVETLLHGATSI